MAASLAASPGTATRIVGALVIGPEIQDPSTRRQSIRSRARGLAPARKSADAQQPQAISAGNGALLVIRKFAPRIASVSGPRSGLSPATGQSLPATTLPAPRRSTDARISAG